MGPPASQRGATAYDGQPQYEESSSTVRSVGGLRGAMDYGTQYPWHNRPNGLDERSRTGREAPRVYVPPSCLSPVTARSTERLSPIMGERQQRNQNLREGCLDASTYVRCTRSQEDASSGQRVMNDPGFSMYGQCWSLSLRGSFRASYRAGLSRDGREHHTTDEGWLPGDPRDPPPILPLVVGPDASWLTAR